MTEAELTAIRERVEKAQTGWSVYRCQFAGEDPESACGLNGETYDHSHDECHHPMSLDLAEYICMVCNAAPALVAEVARLKALARKYSNLVMELQEIEYGVLDEYGQAAHQDRLREIEGGQP